MMLRIRILIYCIYIYIYLLKENLNHWKKLLALKTRELFLVNKNKTWVIKIEKSFSTKETADEEFVFKIIQKKHIYIYIYIAATSSQATIIQITDLAILLIHTGEIFCSYTILENIYYFTV